jgi:Na+-driven multidrug efflux pump
LERFGEAAPAFIRGVVTALDGTVDEATVESIKQLDIAAVNVGCTPVSVIP